MQTAAGLVVLLVEDNLETADVLGRILRLRGYQVAAADDGLDALEMLQGGLRPAAIVLDLWMPSLDGWAFRSALLADPELARIPVVVYSVDAGKDVLPEVVRYVRKGTNPDLLLGAIAAACAGCEERRRTANSVGS